MQSQVQSTSTEKKYNNMRAMKRSDDKVKTQCPKRVKKETNRILLLPVFSIRYIFAGLEPVMNSSEMNNLMKIKCGYCDE